MKKIVAIVQASGYSRRMGVDKLLLPLKGKPIYRHVLDCLQGTELEEILVVSRFEEILRAAKEMGYIPVHNMDAQIGQSRSITLGLQYAAEADGYLFIVADQPFISKETISSIIGEFEEMGGIVLPLYGGKRGSPGLFDGSYRKRLMSLTGEETGKLIIGESQEDLHFIWIDRKEEGEDVDTMEVYERMMSS